jgi:formylglycine-generating enzyme required for sulfatase activity
VPELVTVPPGVFLMGSSTSFWENERPVHEVIIDYGFQLSRYEITFEQYDFFANATDRGRPDDGGWSRSMQPVINVDWEEAVAYGKWLSAQTGQVCRLPSEAEWEYAVRAGGAGDYGLGQGGREIAADNLGDYAWYSVNADHRTREVGTKRPNILGLHDMHGNVWEWAQDCWHDDYHNAPGDGSAWEAADGGDCGRRVLRGGAWFYNANDLRAALRNWSPPDARGTFIGFRVLCVSSSGADS